MKILPVKVGRRVKKELMMNDERMILPIKKIILLTLGVFMLAMNPGKAQTETYSVESNIIYYFTKYVDWPASEKTGEFIIGIYGADHLYNELKIGITGRKVGDQRIAIVKIDDLTDEKFSYPILFIASDKSRSMKKILQATQNKPVLIVTEKEGMITNGSCMNLVILDGKVKLEINQENIESRGLKVAAELLAFDKNSKQQTVQTSNK
ncbi:MAG: YfiR family protein [Bacteroidetes bacterium]|nr:YfiR family protein [Bacteroidota bacterium]